MNGTRYSRKEDTKMPKIPKLKIPIKSDMTPSRRQFHLRYFVPEPRGSYVLVVKLCVGSVLPVAA